MANESVNTSPEKQTPSTTEKLVKTAKPDKIDKKTLRTPNKRLRYGPSQRNKSGPRAKNGSYHNYYSRRNNGIHGDDRIPIVRDVCKLQGKWISILDVGCNDGSMTLEMASMNRCVEAVGVDIDPNLVGAARKKLRERVMKEKKDAAGLPSHRLVQGPVPKSNDTLPLSLRRSLHLMKQAEEKEKGNGKDNGKQHGNKTGNESYNSVDNQFAKFPHNLTFRREDFAQKAATRTSQETGKYDAVLCLSVTKWVHFAGGDEALKRLFRRLHACLKPGGVLVLEPQPLKSYKSAIRKGLGTKDFTGERKLKPHKFVEYLTKTVGFSRMRMLRDVRHRGQAFNRPIMAFYKRREYPLDLLDAALSPDVEAFLGVVPSDAEEQEEEEQREEQNAQQQNAMDLGNNNNNAADEAEEDGENGQIDNEIAEGDGQGNSEQEGRDSTEPQESELTNQATSSGPSCARGVSPTSGLKDKNAGPPVEGMEASSSKRPNGSEAVPPSPGSKRKSTEQNVEGTKAPSSKKQKQDEEEAQPERKSPPKGAE